MCTKGFFLTAELNITVIFLVTAVFFGCHLLHICNYQCTMAIACVTVFCEILLLAHLMDQYCFARWRLLVSVICRHL